MLKGLSRESSAHYHEGNVGEYQEFFTGSFRPPHFDSLPLLKDNISDVPVENKNEIVAYLNDCEIELASSAVARDVFTGKVICADGTRRDDQYEWGKDLAYYVDRYNLKLPDEFVAHILLKCGINE